MPDPTPALIAGAQALADLIADRTAAALAAHMHPAGPPHTITADDLANRLRMDPNQVRRDGRAGRIPGLIRIGRAIRFDASAVATWMRAGGTPDGGTPDDDDQADDQADDPTEA